MKANRLIIISILLFRLNAIAQVTFVQRYTLTGGYTAGYSAQQTSDGGYVMTGTAGSYYTPFIALIKTDQNGDTLWTRKFGNQNVRNVGYSVQETFDGGYVVAGITANAAASPTDIYLIKTDPNGDTMWTKSYSSTGNDFAYSVKQTSDSGFIIAGSIGTLGVGRDDALLIKTNQFGDTLWTKTYGGDSVDCAMSVELTSDGGYILTGYTNSFGSGGYDKDIYLIKTDSVGDTLWTKTYRSINNYNDFGNSVKQTSDGGYIVGGGFANNFIYLMKTDSTGDTLWTRAFSSNVPTATSDQSVNTVLLTSDGGYFVSAISENWIDGWYFTVLFKTDSLGDTLWSRCYSTQIHSEGNSSQQTSDGGFIIGTTSLLKTDADGNAGCKYQPFSLSVLTLPASVVSTSGTVSSGCTVSNPSKPCGIIGSVTTTDCFTTYVNEIKEADIISVFPNPFMNSITVSCSSDIEYELLITNSIGVLVYKGLLKNKECILHLSSLPTGIYFYYLNGREEIHIGKIVKH